MSAEPIQMQEEAVAPSKSDAKQERDRSTIEFAYSPLDVAVEVVRAVHATGGQHSRAEQVAAHMNEAAGSGPFRSKLLTARTFGFAHYTGGTVTLTPLGTRVIDPEHEKSARAEAFLNVALYKRLYEEYKGAMLPPSNQSLEAVFVQMGVAPKQKERARQNFQRSAQQAGYFAYGSTKLVYPTLTGTHATQQKPKEEVPSQVNAPSHGGNGGGDGRHPLLEGLIRALPSGGQWSYDQRRKWLQAAAMNFDFVYDAAPGDAGIIRVSVDNSGSAN